jgi:hypothetical protein
LKNNPEMLSFESNVERSRFAGYVGRGVRSGWYGNLELAGREGSSKSESIDALSDSGLLGYVLNGERERSIGGISSKMEGVRELIEGFNDEETPGR